MLVLLKYKLKVELFRTLKEFVSKCWGNCNFHQFHFNYLTFYFIQRYYYYLTNGFIVQDNISSIIAADLNLFLINQVKDTHFMFRGYYLICYMKSFVYQVAVDAYYLRSKNNFKSCFVIKNLLRNFNFILQKL